MEIKVLGTGCAKCKTTYQTIEKVISENNLEDVKFKKRIFNSFLVSITVP